MKFEVYMVVFRSRCTGMWRRIFSYLSNKLHDATFNKTLIWRIIYVFTDWKFACKVKCPCAFYPQACPPGSMDFRRAQCETFNGKKFMGRTYLWEPFLEGKLFEMLFIIHHISILWLTWLSLRPLHRFHSLFKLRGARILLLCFFVHHLKKY
jgi:hypothetical protein